MSAANRAHPRVPVSASASIAITTVEGRVLRAERIGNISLGGLFIEMNDPPGFGAELKLEIKLSAEHAPFRCEGFVAWSTKNTPDMLEGRSGFGIRLTNLGIQDMKTLAAYVDARIAKKS